MQLLDYMPRLSEKGAIQFIVLLILLLGLVGGVLLVTRGEPLKFLPKAGGGISGPISPQTNFTLAAQKTNYNIGEEVEIKVLVRSDIDPANLFAAKINYDPQFLQLGRVDVTSFVTNWVEQYWGDPGKISLIGGVPTPGFQTQTDYAPAKMVSLYFTALTAGDTTISFEDSSAIYRNSDNINILGLKNGVTIAIGTITSSPTPTPTPSDIGMTLTPSSIKVTVAFGGVQMKVADLINTTNGPVDFELNLPQFFKYGVPLNSFYPASGAFQAGSTLAVGVQTKTTDFAGLEGTYQGTGVLKNKNTGKTIDIPVELTLVLPSLTPSPLPGSGDGNSDGKVNLIDLSILLSDFNKESGFRKGIDLNSDGKINTFDFSLMRNLLIQKGVIRG